MTYAIPAGWIKVGDQYFHPSRLKGARTANPQPAKGVPLVSPVPREETGLRSVQVRFTVWSRRPADADAYHIKELLDMVVHAGIIQDDNFQVVTECAVRSRKCHDKGEERTEIEIIPINENPAD